MKYIFLSLLLFLFSCETVLTLPDGTGNSTDCTKTIDSLEKIIVLANRNVDFLGTEVINLKYDLAKCSDTIEIKDCYFELSNESKIGLNGDAVQYDYNIHLQTYVWETGTPTTIYSFTVEKGECLQKEIDTSGVFYITLEFFKDGYMQNHRMGGEDFKINTIVNLNKYIEEGIGAIWLCSACDK